MGRDILIPVVLLLLAGLVTLVGRLFAGRQRAFLGTTAILVLATFFVGGAAGVLFLPAPAAGPGREQFGSPGHTVDRALPEPASDSPDPDGSSSVTEPEGDQTRPDWATSDDWEYTLQPEVPPILALVMAEAGVSGASPVTPIPVVLASGRVVIDPLAGTESGELILVNLDAHAVSLRGWTILLTASERWLDLPDQILLPCARLSVAVSCSESPPRGCPGDGAPGGVPGGAVLYDSEGTIMVSGD